MNDNERNNCNIKYHMVDFYHYNNMSTLSKQTDANKQTNKHSFIHSFVRCLRLFTFSESIEKYELNRHQRNETNWNGCFRLRIFNFQKERSLQLKEKQIPANESGLLFSPFSTFSVVRSGWVYNRDINLGSMLSWLDKRNATITLAHARFNVPCNVRKPFFIRFWFNFLHH